MFIIDKIYVDTVGLVIRVDMGRDISLATGTQLFIHNPDGTEVVWAATIADLQYLEHTTVSGDLAQSGKYMIQSHLTLGGWTGEGETFELYVFAPFE